MHTRASWTIAKKDTNRRVIDSSGKSVAVTNRRLSQEESEANARLIAAAPNMLKTLTDMDEWLANTGYDPDHPWRLSLGATIAKATNG